MAAGRPFADQAPPAKWRAVSFGIHSHSRRSRMSDLPAPNADFPDRDIVFMTSGDRVPYLPKRDRFDRDEANELILLRSGRYWGHIQSMDTIQRP